MSLLSMVEGLLDARVDFVVIGGLAARAHGSPRITEDLDLCYDRSPENLRRLAECLASWHAYLRGADSGLPWSADVRALRTSPVLTLQTDQGQIDIMDRVAGVGEYAEVFAHSIETTSESLRFRVLDLPSLLAAKRAARRPKDLAQIPELEALLALSRKKKRS
jgi:hypothetical protein